MSGGPTAMVREAPAHVLRAAFLWASHRRRLARMATRSRITRGTVRRFVAGESLPEALDALGRLRAASMKTTVDVLGEAVTSIDEAAASADRYLDVLDALADRGLDCNVSLKLTQMGLDVDQAACRDNVRRILERAEARGAFVRVDMEDHCRTDQTLAIVRELHASRPNVGTVIQSYLRRAAADVEALNRERVSIRLCKGAYDEPAAVAFPAKADVDASYRDLAATLLREGVYPALATHDAAIIEFVCRLAGREGIGRERFEFQMLYGVRRDLQERLAGEGYTVRVYVPFGTEWYPYYMRRLAERPANVLFIARSVLREGRSRTTAPGKPSAPAGRT
jgi:proline dehydrogenase